MANGWSIVIGLIIVVLASAAAWFLSPKGENQTLHGEGNRRNEPKSYTDIDNSDYVLGAMASTHRTQKRRLKTRLCKTYELSGYYSWTCMMAKENEEE
ncbi:hypothetical protein BOTNAR_0144g00180 [Botryotinia narcissicola]|uniref:Uncharacterized protein n=1 Tax=Botryotinia narcissicola TaxID=278944 RepID=A0A4Z1IGK9_9HELO|nr:hypothetical protein BOTNAR_0144g00180 [Botryotinia narcissicola]